MLYLAGLAILLGLTFASTNFMLEVDDINTSNELLPDEEPPNLWDYTRPLVTKATTLENFPNPFVNPKECNRFTEASYVCDPDCILRQSEADRIDELLSFQRANSLHHCEVLGDVPYNLGVALINWLPEEDTEVLAEELLKRWKLDHEKCEDGILLLFVRHRQGFALKWSRAAEPYINARVASSLYPICKSLMRKEKIAQAIEECTSLVVKRITGAILPSHETPQMLVTLVIASLVAFIWLGIVVSTLSEMGETPGEGTRKQPCERLILYAQSRT